ncbi:DUF5067 domain-containing protein [Limosilactobacillus avium]|uniref:DUF5067 domain-containing protein n=1 Tax=Limosilactobacillus avium TaxID=2991831 RepID=UPI0024B945CB|nr:DUF5067 domain-containing protein [Limosilactobacillus avium]
MRSDRYKNLPTPWYKQFWGWVIIAAFVIGILGIVITAVFDGRSTKSPGAATSTTDNITDISKPHGSFDGHTAKLPKWTIKITKVSLTKNDDGKTCMVFNYTAYNKSAKDMSASGMWAQTFSAYQPNKNTQNQLDEEVDVPDSISDEMNQEINKGGHARGEYIAILKSTKRPVLLKAKDDSGNLIGKHKYSFKVKASSKNASAKAKSSDDEQVASRYGSSNGGSSSTGTSNASKAQAADASSSSNNKKTGDWDNHPDVWADDNNDSLWKGTIYENATPQERYDYQVDNVNRWASIDAANGNN